MAEQSKFRPKRSIRRSLLALSVGLTAIGVIVIAAIAVNSIQNVGRRAQEISSQTLRSQVEEYLTQLNQRSAKENDDQLKEISGQIQEIASLAANVFSSPERHIRDAYWPVDKHMFPGPDGQYMNDPGDTSSVFVPNTRPVDDAVRQDIQLSAYLDLILPPIFSNNSNAQAIYFATKNEMVRYYPNINLGEVLPPDFQATERVWFSGSLPENDPDHKPWWTPVYLDATGLGFVTTAATPVYDKNGRLIGVVGFDISLDEMKANIEATQFLENGYSFLIDQDGHAIALTDQGFRDIMGRSPGEGETDIDVSQTETPFAGTIRKMLAGQGGLDLLNVGGRELIVAYSPLESTGWSLGSVVPSASVLKNIASLQTEVDQTTRSLVLNRLLPVSAAIFLILLGLGAFLTNRMVHPIQKLAAAAQQIGSGNWDVEIPRTREDEIGLLANSFQGMASQLRDLVGTLEERVAERTRDLELRSIQMQTAAEVARDITATQELDTLLDRAVQMICNRFGFYFGAIFLIDDLREYAHLRAVTGQARQEILARRLKLKIGEQGIVGYVAAKGEARIARDVDSDETYYRDPLLADTRSEMALPLRVGRRSIGVLDVQSNVPAAFTQDDITILQTLADQLAVAIENARLLEELQKTVQETNDYYQEQAQKAWLLTARRQQTAFEYDQLRVRPLENKLPPEVMARLQDGHAITLNGDTPGNGHSPTSLVAPVMLRQQVIGVIGLEQDDPHHSWSPEEIAIVEAAASQAAMTLENARLYLESQEKAERERVIGEITEKMQRANDMDTLVARLLQELQQVFDASYAVVHLKQER